MEDKRPKVGVGVIVVRDGRILIGKRLAGHGSDTYQIPGGHLEFGEGFEDAAKREVEEETGLVNLLIKGVVSIGNDRTYDKHYISIGVLVESLDGEPRAEVGKSQDWKWYDKDNLPEGIFLPSKKVIDNWLNGTIYSD